ncbi:diguanylate cyclase [Spirochaetota bacterium]
MENKPTYEDLLDKVEELKKTEKDLKQNEKRLESLLALSQMDNVTEQEIREYALEIVVTLTRSTGGYLHFVNEDNKTIDLVSWSKEVMTHCTAEKTQHYPIDSAGIWADSVRLRTPVVHNDYPQRTDRKGYPKGHFHVLRHLSVPIFDMKKIVAVAGVGNKVEPYNDEDIRQTMLFMNSMWSILKDKKAEAVLKKYSMEDGLTGLANRRRFNEVMGIEWQRACRNKTNLSVIMVDIDNFKSYNDIYGHQVGDECLCKTAESINNNIRRAGEMVARYGGEEFVAVIPSVKHEDALKLGELICSTIEEMKIPHECSEGFIFLTVSAGVATIVPSDELTSADLIRMADRELYRAKHEGKNRVMGVKV